MGDNSIVGLGISECFPKWNCSHMEVGMDREPDWQLVCSGVVELWPFRPQKGTYLIVFLFLTVENGFSKETERLW